METTHYLDRNVSGAALAAGPLSPMTRRRTVRRNIATPLLTIVLVVLFVFCNGSSVFAANALDDEIGGCSFASRQGASQSVTQSLPAGAGSVIVNTPEIVIPFPGGTPPPKFSALRILGATGSVTTDKGGSGNIAVKAYSVVLVSANAGALLFARSAFPGNPWGNTATPSADGATFFVNLDFNHVIRSTDFPGLDDLSSGVAILGRAQISNNDLSNAHNVTVSVTALWATCSKIHDP